MQISKLTGSIDQNFIGMFRKEHIHSFSGIWSGKNRIMLDTYLSVKLKL